MLVGMVLLAASFLTSGRDFWVATVAGWLFTVPMAISEWKIAPWRRDDGATYAPASWRDGVLYFFCGLVISAIFIAIDVAADPPGFSLMLTVAVVSLTLIAVPSALRAWLMEWLAVRFGRSDG